MISRFAIVRQRERRSLDKKTNSFSSEDTKLITEQFPYSPQTTWTIDRAKSSPMSELRKPGHLKSPPAELPYNKTRGAGRKLWKAPVRGAKLLFCRRALEIFLPPKSRTGTGSYVTYYLLSHFEIHLFKLNDISNYFMPSGKTPILSQMQNGVNESNPCLIIIERG